MYRIQRDIDRSQRLPDAAQAQVFSDVDFAYAAVNSNLILLRPHQAKYLKEVERVRETVAYSYQRGGASPLDFLRARNGCRAVQLNYVNLLSAYLTAAA